MKKILAAICMSMATITVQAEISGNASLTSDYRFRGISQSQKAPAIQGGIDYAHKSGLYVGNWNSSVSSEVYLQGSGMESDLYAGFRQTLGPATFDVGVISYFYPNARTGGSPDRYHTDEVYVGTTVGMFSARVHQAYSDYFGMDDSRNTRYYQIKADVPVIKNVTFNAAVGRTDVANQTTNDYDDWRVGATVAAGGFDFGLHYYGTEKTTDAFRTANTVNGKKNFDRGAVLTATKLF